VERDSGGNFDDEDEYDDEVDARAKWWHQRVLWTKWWRSCQESLRPCAAYPATRSHAVAVIDIAAMRTKLAAIAVSIAMTRGRPSATAKPT